MAKDKLKSNPDVEQGNNDCFEYVFNDYFISVIKDIDGITRFSIADIDLYGSIHSICIVKINNQPLQLKIFCSENTNDLDFTIFEEPDFFRFYREFYEKLMENFLLSDNKMVLKIPKL
jgi:hypothetical protein